MLTQKIVSGKLISKEITGNMIFKSVRTIRKSDIFKKLGINRMEA